MHSQTTVLSQHIKVKAREHEKSLPFGVIAGAPGMELLDIHTVDFSKLVQLFWQKNIFYTSVVRTDPSASPRASYQMQMSAALRNHPKVVSVVRLFRDRYA